MGEAVKPRDVQPTEESGVIQGIPSGSYPIESIYGIGRRYSEALRGIGVETVGEVAKITDIDEFEELLGIPAKVLHMIRLRALSYISGEIMQAEPFEFPSDRLIFIDIETDPACRRVWLIGLLVDGWFTQLFADSWDEERLILEKFQSFLETHRGYTLVSYSGTSFDYRVTLNAMRRHSLDTTFLEEYPHIDLCTLLRRCFIFPHHSYALKELGAYLGYGFRRSELDGLQVSLAYLRHVETGVPLANSILEYNEDDVRTVKHLIDRCLKLRRCSNVTYLGRVHFDTGRVYVETKLDPWLQ